MMKIPCWTISNGFIVQGIKLSDERKISVLKYQWYDEKYCVKVPFGSFVDKNILLSIKRTDRLRKVGAVALIHIKDHSGYGGIWQIVPYATSFCSKKFSFHYDTCAKCKYAGRSGLHNLLPPPEPVAISSLGIVLSHRNLSSIDRQIRPISELLFVARPCKFSIKRYGTLYNGETDRINVIVHSDGKAECVSAEHFVSEHMNSTVM